VTDWLRQSTSVTVQIGPFLDSTDGTTVEGALTITQPDIRLSKNGGTWAQKAAAQTLTHAENGWYPVTLDATDTNTLGRLKLAVNETGALQVWDSFMVLPAQVWDSLFGTDLLDVSVTQWLGTAVPTPGTAGVPSVDTIRIATAIVNNLSAQLGVNLVTTSTDAITGSSLAASVGTEIADAVALRAGTDPSVPPAINAGQQAKIDWICAWVRNLQTMNRSTGVVNLRNDANSATIGTLTVSDDGTTLTRPKVT
jgi:hypothetical protein